MVPEHHPSQVKREEVEAPHSSGMYSPSTTNLQQVRHARVPAVRLPVQRPGSVGTQRSPLGTGAKTMNAAFILRNWVQNDC